MRHSRAGAAHRQERGHKACPGNIFGRIMSDAHALPELEARLSKLRHDLSNPLSALLAETQLLLLNEATLDAETRQGLREIESLAIRMRTILRESAGTA